MTVWFVRRREPGLAELDKELDGLVQLAGLGKRLTPADRACCCPGRPVVTVVMPAVPGGGPPVDLLLCGHHYRVSQAALLAVGAAVYDADGVLITGDSEPSARTQVATSGGPGSFRYVPGQS